MTHIPSGWRGAALAEFCDVSPSDPALPSSAPFVPMDSVDVGSRWPRYYEARGSRGGVRARDDDVLFARITPCLENGKLAQVPSGTGPVGGSTEFIVIRPGPDVDAAFLYYWCLEPSMRADARSMMAGVTGRMRLSGKQLATFQIPVPPLREQRRIVDVLEDHLSRLDAAEQLLSSADVRARAWQTSFLDRCIWQSEWPEMSVAALLSEPLRNGHSARASADGGGIRTLTLTAVTLGRFESGYTKMTVADPNRVSDLWLRPGDILVERSNTPELVGTTAYYDGPADWAIFPDLLIRARVNDQIVRPQFAGAAMSSARASRWLRGQAKGLSGSMPKIDQGTIGALRIPIPLLGAQDALLARMAEAVPNSRRMASSLAYGRQRTIALRRALLQAAFSGQLTGRSSDLDRAEEAVG